MNKREAARLDELVAELGDKAAYCDLDTARTILDTIRVILGGSPGNTPEIDRVIAGIDSHIADTYNTQ